MTYCNDCGEKVFNGHCTWCHEEVYIMEQHMEQGTDYDLSQEFINKYQEQIKNPQKNDKI